ncbi:MAG: hypothetical protein JWN37_377 [Candidatus Nomurabacteria bacterium]|nr:hypothetical protein [Candidatus Nomurabacteria bacterium]
MKVGIIISAILILVLVLAVAYLSYVAKRSPSIIGGGYDKALESEGKPVTSELSNNTAFLPESKENYKASFNESSFLLQSPSKTILLALPQTLKEGVEKYVKLKNALVSVLDAATKDKNMYILIKVSMVSNPANPNGMCGAGEENYLIWLKVNDADRIVESNYSLYDSCIESIVMDTNKSIWSGEKITIVSDNYTTTKGLRIYYDYNHREQGLKIEETRLNNGI